MKFVMFDIQNFYPSIAQDLLNKALNIASEYIYISKCDIDFINHARKSLLFDGFNTWIKKQGGLFDVSIYRKYFCSLSRSFFMVILKKFSFGSGFLEWVEAVLKNQWLFAIDSGRRKPYFKLEK